jgi:hypothetical protein
MSAFFRGIGKIFGFLAVRSIAKAPPKKKRAAQQAALFEVQ